MAVEHAMFKFEDLKVNSNDDRQTDRMTTKVLISHPRIYLRRAPALAIVSSPRETFLEDVVS